MRKARIVPKEQPPPRFAAGAEPTPSEESSGASPPAATAGMRKARVIKKETPPAAPRPSDPISADEIASGQVRGFKDALASLVDRKLRELKGIKWIGASDYAKENEAKRRAVADWSRRIAKETGKKPLADSTIRRYARQDQMPAGVDGPRVNRQGIIDRAGGIRAFAQRLKIKESRARRWRDKGGTITVIGALVVIVNVDGALIRDNEHYKKIGVSHELRFDGHDAQEFRIAFAENDVDRLMELIGEALVEQYYGENYDNPLDEYEFNVTVITSIEIRD